MAKAVSMVVSVLLLVGVDRVAEHWRRVQGEASPVETQPVAQPEIKVPNGITRSNLLPTPAHP